MNKLFCIINEKVDINDKKIYIFILLFIIFFLFRIFNLDADIVPWGIMNYQPVDEGIYGNLALNLINYGNINPNVFFHGNLYLMQGHVITNFIGNIIVYIGLLFLGDNYYGFRIPIILTSLFISILIILSCYFVAKSKKIIYIIFFMLFSFHYYIASRIVEPSIFRLLFTTIVLFLIIQKKIGKKQIGFLVGFLITLSCFLVYITNFFMYLGSFLFIIYCFITKEKDEAKTYLVYGMFGIILALFLSQIYYSYFWKTDIITNTINQVQSFQYDKTYASSYLSLITILQRGLSFISSNLFLYSLPILFFILINIKKAFYSNHRKITILCLSYIVSFLIQTFVSEDYVVRKSIVILPFYLILFYIILTNNSTYKKNNIILNFSFIILCYIIMIFRLNLINNGTELDFGSNDKFLIYALFISCLFYLFIYYANINFFSQITFIFLIFILINSLFIFRYCFKNVTYYEKNGMVALNAFNGEVIMGEYINGFTLYNNVKPLLNTEDTLREYFKNDKFQLYFDYYDIDDIVCERFQTTHIEKILEVKRNFLALGSKRNMGVYKLSEENYE